MKRYNDAIDHLEVILIKAQNKTYESQAILLMVECGMILDMLSDFYAHLIEDVPNAICWNVTIAV